MEAAVKFAAAEASTSKVTAVEATASKAGTAEATAAMAATASTTCHRHGGAARPTAATANAIIAFRNISFSIQDLAPSTNPQIATVPEHCDEHPRNGGSTRRESVVKPTWFDPTSCRQRSSCCMPSPQKRVGRKLKPA
jgi:hypothetical protein